MRSAIFDRLQFELPGMRILDPFAGTGALAIEGVSRGAASAVCFEQDVRMLAFLRQQILALELGDRIEVVEGDALRLLARPCARAFDLVLLDPPYDAPDLPVAAAAAALGGGWLADGAIVVAEHAGDVCDWPPELELERRIEHGDTTLDFLRIRQGTRP